MTLFTLSSDKPIRIRRILRLLAFPALLALFALTATGCADHPHHRPPPPRHEMRPHRPPPPPHEGRTHRPPPPREMPPR